MSLAVSVVLAAVFAFESWAGDPFNPDDLERWGALVVPTTPSESWRLLTSTLLHAGALHLVFNILALLFFGRYVEALYGRIRYLVLYVGAGVLSGVGVHLFAETRTTLVGASGAIFGLAGAALAALLRRSDLRRTPLGARLIRTFVLLLVIQIPFDALIPHVASSAHASGFAAGLVLGFLLVPIPRAA